jgi:NAD(P)-dependent dehydrogenase (short-subunit alcohol dehydrogenase family)
MLNTPSPLPHIEPKVWDDLMAVNVTANWQLIRTLDPLLKRAEAGRAVFMTSGLSFLARSYFGLYAASKAALEIMVRTYADEVAQTKVRANLFSPGQTRTRMMATAFPGVDPETLPPPEAVAQAIVPLCLASCIENGRFYDYRAGKFLDFHPPS